MKVLITGAAGYMGKHVVKAFLNAGHDVYVSDFQYKGIDERAKIVDEPIFSGDKDVYEKLGRPDVLVHLAWRDGFIHNSHAHMRDLSSHITFLENMIDGGLKYLTVMGTMHEIGYWEGAIDENTPCNPMSMYGIAKNALRQSLMLYVKDKDVNLHWLRAYYIYGDDMRGSSIFAKLCQAEEDGKEEFPFTTGKNKYDFIHVDQLSEMICAASVQSEINGIINVCTGEPMTLAEKVESFIKEHGFKIKLKYGAFPDRPYDSPGEWGDATLIKNIMENA
ncbi:NAD-dependent epimerase/dehydratase family protein [Lachnospira multipara]|uniref:NAD-dependent epimerase/dehydratase family protein n=1 Tax=Lachnospira multipara TaxID=28051 RepID=UPI00040D25AF|nr:NAD(P)-dependent oxidoreductase [Lachnospira multipara]